jgi:hypothetical protein
VLAGKTSLSSAILTGGCQATTNSAGIVLSDRSIAERLFGFSTPGLLMKGAAPRSDWDNRASPTCWVSLLIRR